RRLVPRRLAGLEVPVLPRLLDAHPDLVVLHRDHDAAHPFPVADAHRHLAAHLHAFPRHCGARFFDELVAREHHWRRRAGGDVALPGPGVVVAAWPAVAAEAMALIIVVAAFVALALPLAASPCIRTETLAPVFDERAFVAVAVRPGLHSLAVFPSLT